MYVQTDLISGSNFELFPQFQISKHLVKNVLFVEGGIRSVRTRNTIKYLSDENPYIVAPGSNQINEQYSPISQNLKNTDIKNELYFEMENVIGKDEIFNGGVSYGKITNLHIYYWINLDKNGRFYFSYVDVWRLSKCKNYKWQINDLIGINKSINYFNYDTTVSNKENINGNFDISFNLDEKIKVNTSISYLGEKKIFLSSNGDFETSEEINWIDEYIFKSSTTRYFY